MKTHTRILFMLSITFLILISCGFPALKDAPYKIVNPDANTMIHGVFPQSDGSYEILASTLEVLKPITKHMILKYDQDLNEIGRTTIHLDSLAVIQKCVESNHGYWLLQQTYVHPEYYHYDLVHIDQNGNPLHAEAIMDADRIIRMDLFSTGNSGILVVYDHDSTFLYSFTEDEIAISPWLIPQEIDRIKQDSGMLLAGAKNDGILTISELDMENHAITPIKTVDGFDANLGVKDFTTGNTGLVALYTKTDAGPVPSDSRLFMLESGMEIPYEGYVVKFLDNLILGVQKSKEKPDLTTLVAIQKITKDGKIEMLSSFDPKVLMIPDAVRDGESIILYGHVGHPLFGLTGFIQKIAMP